MLLKLADTVLIFINMDPSNVKGPHWKISMNTTTLLKLIYFEEVTNSSKNSPTLDLIWSLKLPPHFELFQLKMIKGGVTTY